MSKVAIIGTGYVGLTTGACLAKLGHEVICIDNDPTKVARLSRGVLPIVEEGLDELVTEGLQANSLSFTGDARPAVEAVDFVFLCLPTPDLPDGTVDMSYVDEVARQIGPFLKSGAIVVNKSTVPVGAAFRVERLLNRSDVRVASNPEFLREGSAVSDFFRPSRIVVGAANKETARLVLDLYRDLGAQEIIADTTSAETIKYAANAFLATKISFINSIANICEHVGADIRIVADAIGRDPRIGSQFLQPGPGFGGSCFPKDTIGLVRLAEEAGYRFSLLESVIEANTQQLNRVVGKVASAIGGELTSKKVAVWGLTFKAHTDDRRHSPAVEIVRTLVERGARISVFDPTVDTPVDELNDVVVAANGVEACREADVLVVLTEWPVFREIDPRTVQKQMVGRKVVDARNLLDVDRWVEAGFHYQGIGFSRES